MVPFALHRIGSKRVVFELLQQADSKRKNRPTHLKRLSLALVVTLLSSFVLVVGVFDATDYQTVSAPRVSNQVCVSLAGLKSEEVKDIANFELAGWQIVTFGETQTIGGLSAISFEATCDDLIASGELTFAKSEAGSTILRIAPI